MKCNKCGHDNARNSKFCLNCGEMLEKNKFDNKDEKKETVVTQNVSNVSINNKSKKNVLPFIMIAFGVVLLIVAVFFIVKMVISKKDSNGNSLYNNNELIKITENGKYGYIDLNGKVIIEPTLEYATDFKHGYAVISGTEVSETGVENDVYKVIDTKGKVFATALSSYQIDCVEYEDSVLWIISGVLYDNNFKQLTSDTMSVRYEDEGYFSFIDNEKGKGGIINSKGKVTYTYNFVGDESYISIEPSETTLSDRYCEVNIDNEKYGIVNCDTGKIIYDFSKLYISVYDNNIFKIKEKSTFDFVSLIYIQGDKIIYETDDSSTDLSYSSNGYIKISEKDPNGKYSYSKKYSYIDVNTGVISDKAPEVNLPDIDLDSFEELTGYKKFSCDSGYGIMSGDTVVLKCEWKSISFLDNTLYEFLKSKGKNYVVAKKEDKYYLVDLKSKDVKAEFNTKSFSSSSSLFVKYTDADTSEYVVYNLVNGKSATFEKDSNIVLKNNYFKISKNDSTEYYNSDLKLIYTAVK